MGDLPAAIVMLAAAPTITITYVRLTAGVPWRALNGAHLFTGLLLAAAILGIIGVADAVAAAIGGTPVTATWTLWAALAYGVLALPFGIGVGIRTARES